MTKVKKEILVHAPVEAVYGAWHNFENLPRFMENIEEVRVVSGSRSHWKAKGPLGKSAEWDAEITMDEKNESIGWRSIDDSSVTTAGRVSFVPVSDSTRIEVTMEYDAPAGPLGDLAAKIFSNPDKQVEEDLRRFQEAIERGVAGSGFAYEPAGNETFGSSMGATTEADIEAMNAGAEPTAVVDPATRL